MTGHHETKFYPIKKLFLLSVEMFHKSKQRSGLFKVSHMPIFFICVFREDIFVFRGTIRCLRFVFWNWHNRYCLFICLYSWTFVICVIVLLKLITSQLISKRENLIFELPSYSNIWKASHQSKGRQKHPRWKWWVVHGLNPWLQ